MSTTFADEGEDIGPEVASAGTSRAGEPVAAVLRACALLEALGTTRQPSSVLDMARTTGQNRTSVHRLLRTLEVAGFVQRQGSRYRLSQSALLLGTGYLEQDMFRRVSLPYAIELFRRLVGDRPWIVSLTMPVRNEIIVIDRFPGPNAPLEAIPRIGARFRFERTSSGLSALAYMDHAAAADVMGADRLADLHPVLEEIRRNDGIATYESEGSPGLYGIGRCVRNATGEPVGAVAVSGFDLREEVSAGSQVWQSIRGVAAHVEHVLAT